MLLVDYSSAFSTIVPSKLIIKLEALGLNPSLCNWVLDFLTGRPQVVKVFCICIYNGSPSATAFPLAAANASATLPGVQPN